MRAVERGRGRGSGARMGAGLRALALAALVLFAPGQRLAFAQADDAALERRVKAAFLFRFIQYIEWPAQAFPQPDTPVVIAIAGNEAAAAEVEAVIGGRTALGRHVAVRRLAEGDSLAGVHLVYISRAESARIPAIAKAAQSTATLVVTDADREMPPGSMINFRLVEGKVRFEIALGPTEHAGLRVSSRMLAIAQFVRPAP